MFQFSGLLEEAPLQRGANVHPGQLCVLTQLMHMASDVMPAREVAKQRGVGSAFLLWRRGAHIGQNGNHLLRITFPRHFLNLILM